MTARRRDIDYERGGINLPDSKSGEPQWLALSAPAMAIIQVTPALTGNPYLLPSTRKEKHHLVNVDDAWWRVRDRASVTRWAEDAEPSVSGLVTRLQE